MGIYNPNQTIIVTSREKDFNNAITIGWHTPVSKNPFYYAVFLAKKRKSYEMIVNTKKFCVNFLSEEMKDLAFLCGTKSGRDFDKFKEIEKEECETIDCARLKDCSAYLECKVIKIEEFGDHVMFLGQVIKEKQINDKKRLMHVSSDKEFIFTTTR